MLRAASYEDSQLVFATSKGIPRDARNIINRSFDPLLEKARLPPIRFHDLRHTCATLLLGKGIHPRIIQGILGHASIGLTLDTYSHVLPDLQDQGVSAMEALLE